MKQLFIVTIIVLLTICTLQAQDIIRCEYYFDEDPGFGLATALSIAPAQSIDADFTINISSLESGFHTLYARILTNQGEWSNTQQKRFYIIADPTNPGALAAIETIEYFFDNNDLGPGSNPNLGPATPQAMVDVEKAIATAGLSAGLHTINIRTKSTGGIWSNAKQALFYIKSDPTNPGDLAAIETIEYFFDGNDQGPGSNPNLGPASPQAMVDVEKVIATAGLSAGLHTINIRAKNTAGIWGNATQAVFYVHGDILNMLSDIEYFIDGPDPGLGNGQTIDPDDANTWDDDYIVPVTTALNLGQHSLSVRIHSISGLWSTTRTLPFTVADCNIPGELLPPQGVDMQCTAITEDEFTASGADGASYYEWMIYPDDAGTLQVSDNTMILSRDPAFEGRIELRVRAVNDCAGGPWSARLFVDVSADNPCHYAALWAIDDGSWENGAVWSDTKNGTSVNSSPKKLTKVYIQGHSISISQSTECSDILLQPDNGAQTYLTVNNTAVLKVYGQVSLQWSPDANAECKLQVIAPGEIEVVEK